MKVSFRLEKGKRDKYSFEAIRIKIITFPLLTIRTDHRSKHTRGLVAVSRVNSVDSIYVARCTMNFDCHTLLGVISITRDSNRLLTICSQPIDTRTLT